MAEETLPPPPPVPQPIPRVAPAAIWSLVLAVLSFFCGWLFTAIPAVICGHIARSKIRKSGGGLGGKGIGYRGANLGLYRTRARYHGHPAACQYDPVGSRAVATALH